MKIRFISALLALVVIPSVKAQDQLYSTVDITANVLEIAYDKKLAGAFNSGGILAQGIRGSDPTRSSWTPVYGSSMGEYWDIQWVKLNKTVACNGQDVSDFIVLPVRISSMPSNYAATYPNLPWYADPDSNESYVRLKEFFFASYLNTVQVKVTKILCGAPQLHPIKNQLVPVAYITSQKYFTILPKQSDNSANNSAWVNGVQVTPTSSQPTNAVVTNWNFTVPTAGNYDVYVHWVSNKNQVANIAYAVDGQTLKSAALDQNINAGIWTKLIKNTQYSAGEHSIKISVDSNANYVVDGVRAEKTAQ